MFTLYCSEEWCRPFAELLFFLNQLHFWTNKREFTKWSHFLEIDNSKAICFSEKISSESSCPNLVRTKWFNHNNFVNWNKIRQLLKRTTCDINHIPNFLLQSECKMHNYFSSYKTTFLLRSEHCWAKDMTSSPLSHMVACRSVKKRHKTLRINVPRKLFNTQPD